MRNYGENALWQKAENVNKQNMVVLEKSSLKLMQNNFHLEDLEGD